MAEPKKKLTKVPLGPTGITVAENVKRLMDQQNLNYSQLVAKLIEVGRPIPLLGVRNIVAMTRRADVDDLFGLAAALKVSPTSLLMPYVDEGSEEVEATAVGQLEAYTLWIWLEAGGCPHEETSDMDWIEFSSRALPPFAKRELARAAKAVASMAKREGHDGLARRAELVIRGDYK